MKIIMIFISSYTIWWPIGVWSVEGGQIRTSASASGCREGEVRWKLGNSSAFIAQSISMIKKKTL
jgi:hypothetical protein